jgi:hypothetical protein
VLVFWVILPLDLLAFAYGCMNVITPRRTRAWQVGWTERHADRALDTSVGRTVQQLVGDNPTKPPDRAVFDGYA